MTCLTFHEQLKWFYALSEAKLVADKGRRPESMLLLQEEMEKVKVMRDNGNLNEIVKQVVGTTSKGAVAVKTVPLSELGGMGIAEDVIKRGQVEKEKLV